MAKKAENKSAESNEDQAAAAQDKTEKRLTVHQGVAYQTAIGTKAYVRTYVNSGSVRFYVLVPEGTVDITRSDFEKMRENA